MQHRYSLYRHTSPSGKVYIGITSQDPVEQRWQNGLGYRRNPHFFRAIVKYGWSNIKHEVLARGLTKSAACDLERALIQQHRSNDKRYGYNITAGGEQFNHTEESKQLMSERRKGKGKGPKSEEWKAKARANHSGGSGSKPVVCVETQQKYNSVKEASRATGIDSMPISRCCRGVKHYNTAGGYHWQFVE